MKKKPYFKGSFGKHQRVKREKFLPFKARPFCATYRELQNVWTDINKKQDCSYQGEALIIPTVFQDLWSSNNLLNKINVKKKIENFFYEF